MNVFESVTITITHDGRGLAGAVEQLHDAGYYATVTGSLGDVVILYGPRFEVNTTRMPYVALVGDTLHVSQLAEKQQQHPC